MESRSPYFTQGVHWTGFMNKTPCNNVSGLNHNILSRVGMFVHYRLSSFRSGQLEI